MLKIEIEDVFLMIKNFTTNFIEEQNGKLVFDKVIYSDLLKKYKTPLFIILPNIIRENIALLKASLSEFFPHFEIFYSLKTNYHDAVIKTIKQTNIGVETVSLFEMSQTLRYWSNLSEALYGGLFKTPEQIQFAVSNKVKYISVESIRELPLIDKAAQESGLNQKILLRLKSVSNQYLGINIRQNINQLRNVLAKSQNISLVGLHIHTPTKKTFYNEFVGRVIEILELLSFLESKMGISLSHVNLGGGLPESSMIHKNDLLTLFTKLKDLFEGHGYSTKRLNIILEPGRFVVGNACVFLSKIIDIRTINGKKCLVLNVGIHQIPKFGKGELRFLIANDVKSSYNANFSIIGPLPTETDILRRNYNLSNHVNINSPIAILNAGAYTFSMWRRFCTDYPRVISIDRGQIIDYYFD